LLAGPSTTRVEFFGLSAEGTKKVIATYLLPTPELKKGAVWFIGDAGSPLAPAALGCRVAFDIGSVCQYSITTDLYTEVDETSETNNDVIGFCNW
jgi:hypothetical protein